MMIRSTALALALVVAGTAPAMAAEGRDAVTAQAAPVLTAAISRAAAEAAPLAMTWAVDRPIRRPGALPALYGSYAALQVMDFYTTKRALGAGSTEVNPLLTHGNGAAMLGVKAAAGAATIYFTERAWKKNRTGAIVLMAVLNGATAAVVARNAQHARR